ncbi:MAG TPA: 4-(cytidine 5'-diphospho)-2-C-methyl-D-erythritol kinase [Acidimicrobiales bacterium]|nr:4-(cytidine 5'-diphospho)-2-C-methyl-D-erythritol kinase [Acidimicrobiales bacterium]
MSVETLLAFAKLTRTLRVVGVRDDGLHLIDAEMVTLDFADVLRVRDGGVNDLPAGDLVSRALAAAGRSAHVQLDKRIPVGAGLGGGSADAAAILRWAGCTSVGVAVGLGADVPFCLLGGGRARVRGIGEVVESLPPVDLSFTLLTPPLHVSTPAVYAAWDRLGGPTVSDGPNDLEPAALAVEPRLAEWRDRLGEATGLTPALAGSGGTWFVEGAFPHVPGALVTRTRNDRP